MFKLTDFGKSQASFASKYASQLDLHTVFVSPLRRALQTAHYLLKDHPNFSKIKFIMHPDLREHIYSVGEIPLDLSKTTSMYNYYDTSYMFLGAGGPAQKI
jgi:bisphosphoglycerate-dependent phosphoglycerate mutase